MKEEKEKSIWGTIRRCDKCSQEYRTDIHYKSVGGREPRHVICPDCRSAMSERKTDLGGIDAYEYMTRKRTFQLQQGYVLMSLSGDGVKADSYTGLVPR